MIVVIPCAFTKSPIIAGFDWDRQQIMQCYMALGGTPYYLQMLDKDSSIMQNIDRLFFTMDDLFASE